MESTQAVIRCSVSYSNRVTALVDLEELVEFRGVSGVVLGVVGGDLLQPVARPVVQVLDCLARIFGQGLAWLLRAVLRRLDDPVAQSKLTPAAFDSNSAACDATVRACPRNTSARACNSSGRMEKPGV
ncbi:hypothetical protein ACFVT2_04260 [Streptomyces sp. NPDC058000]|uniref:hypothetical protein n=1 Tax=Streptomyces sp. NPDC058000 TaxID=3346299 RepID=UPI0036E13DD5